MSLEKTMTILLSPYQTEKTVLLAEKKRQFAFKIASNTNKIEVKRAVETMFNVKVKNVSILNVKAKTKRFKQMLGKRKAWKKAYVTLHEGFDINFTDSSK